MKDIFIEKAGIFRTVIFLGMVLLTFPQSTVFAKAPGGHLSITEVSVDLDASTLTIRGQDLDFGPGPLTVSLGEYGSLVVSSATETEIVAQLPNPIDSGDYLLTVSMGNGQSQNADYGLTIDNAVSPPPSVISVMAEPQGEDGNHHVGVSLYDVQDACGAIGGLPFEAGIFDNPNSNNIRAEVVDFVQFAPDVQFKVIRFGGTPQPGDVINAPVEFYVRCLDPNVSVEPVVTVQTPGFVFVTSGVYRGNIGGLAGADQVCNNEAGAFGLPGTYKAWLSSDPDNTPDTRFTKNPAGYQRADGVSIAISWQDLTKGSIRAPINLDAAGNPVNSGWQVWTSTDTSGKWSPSWGGAFSSLWPRYSCQGWTTSTTSSSWRGMTGSISSGSSWTGQNPKRCNETAKLYCFQQ